VSIFPESVADVPVVAATVQPSKTFYLDFTSGEIPGSADGETAMRQAIHKAIATNLLQPKIYDGSYGSELESLIGSNHSTAYLQSEIPRMLRDALVYDDRIDSVTDVQISVSGDVVYIEFMVTLSSGETLAITEGVSL
jgi:hypothetical protein